MNNKHQTLAELRKNIVAAAIMLSTVMFVAMLVEMLK
jgi:hypothetical protein